jgi:hypothetical protein
MKVVALPIDMVAYFTHLGEIRPVRFRLEQNGEIQIIKIQKIISTQREKMAGNQMQIFDCNALIRDELKTFQLKYDIDTTKWILFKI